MNSVSSSTVNSSPSAAVAQPKTERRPVAAADGVAAPRTNGQAGGSAAGAKPTAEEIKLASEDLRQRVNTLAPELNFSIDETSGRSVIKFTDRATNQVIRQFPSEEALQLTRAMDQFQRGLLLNRKV